MVGNGNVTFGRAFFLIPYGTIFRGWLRYLSVTLFHLGKANKFVLHSTYATLLVTKSAVMSEKELNAYRLTSMEEPTDEMLSAIMKEAAEDAAKSTAEALDNYFKEILSMMNRKLAAV